MKNAKIGLLVLSVFAFQNMDAKSDKKEQEKQRQERAKQAVLKRQAAAKKAVPVKKGAAPVVVEENSHKVEVSERTIKPNERVAPSQETNMTENPETGMVTEVTTTVTPMPQENKVVTTTETRTWTDTAITAGKYALGAAAIAGAGYLAYQNHEGFRNGVDGYAQSASDQANSWSTAANKKIGELEKSAAERIANVQNSYNNWRSGTPAAATTAVNEVLTQDPVTVMDTAEAISQASSNPQDAQMADDIATKIQDAVDNGEKPSLNAEESNFLMDKVVEYKNELAVGTAAIFTGLAAKKFGPGIVSRLNPSNTAAQGVTAGLAKFSESAQPAAAKAVSNPSITSYSSGLAKTPDYAKPEELAKKVTQNREAQTGARAEIDAQSQLRQQYQNRVTADQNRQQAAAQLAKQERMLQNASLTAANLGIAGGIAAGTNALANANMNAPSMNSDYAAQYN
jgi:hypothetical protein